ncbi:MAG: agmatinase [Pseudomonadales bacterium]
MNDDFASHSMFANTFSMFGRSLSRDVESPDVDLVIMGIPFDLGTSGRAGTRHGPQGVRMASANLRWEEKRWPWGFDAFDRINVIDSGDIETPAGDSTGMFTGVEAQAHRVLAADKCLLSIGGDHLVTLPLLRAAAKVHGPLALVHFDAHTDTYNEEDGIYDHGCMFYHAPREGLVDADHSIQIGIRTEYTVSEHLFQVIDAAEANDLSAADIVDQIRARVGDMPVYLTFDIDCLDPAYAPGTGTPVAGGLTSDRALKIIRGLVGLNIVAMDVVEVAPSYDNSEITSLAAATLALEMIYVKAADKDD